MITQAHGKKLQNDSDDEAPIDEGVNSLTEGMTDEEEQAAALKLFDIVMGRGEI